MSLPAKVSTVAESVQRAVDTIRASMSPRPRRGAAVASAAATASLADSEAEPALLVKAEPEDAKGGELDDFVPEEQTPPPSPKKKRRKKSDGPIVYEIPPVEQLETSYR